MATPAMARPKRRALYFAPFALIAALFVGTDLLAMRRVHAIRGETDVLVSNMLSSVEQVTRMRHDLDRIKILADRHVFEEEAVAMSALDAQIRSAQADFAAAARAYGPLATLPGEAATWSRVQSKVADVDRRLDSALSLSRRNEDEQAYQEMVALDQSYHALNGDLAELISINHEGAQRVLQRVDGLQRSAEVEIEVLALAGAVISLVVGLATRRILRRRDDLQRHYAQVLEECNRELDAFAGRVAHDLRAPLGTATLAASHLARQGRVQGKTFDVLRRSFDRMDALIEDLLTISRMQLTGEASVCDPAATAAELREELAPRVRQEGVSLEMDVQPARVLCRSGLLREVLWNLADNAMKYRRREPGARIEVTGRAIDDHYELSVQDNGVGMSAEDARRAFDPLYRAPQGKDRQGTGLGLSIVKRVIEASGGTVSVTSEPGMGSRFVTRLPLEQAERRAPAGAIPSPA